MFASAHPSGLVSRACWNAFSCHAVSSTSPVRSVDVPISRASGHVVSTAAAAERIAVAANGPS